MKILITAREDRKDEKGIYSAVFEPGYEKWIKKLFPQAIVQNIDSSFETTDDALRDASLVILSGGGTVPNQYRITPTDEYQQNGRDRLEASLLKCAEMHQIKVLGICRGMQFVNGFYGGKVRSIRDDHVKPGVCHPLEVMRFSVNSFHNDGMLAEDVSPSFSVLAMFNNVVEAMISNDKRILGVQWHPERNGPSSEFEIKSNEFILNWFYKGA